MAAAIGWRIFLRSFLVQASWNFERLQNLGFFLMAGPTLARRYSRGSDALAQAGLRHLRQFNTHPYFAGLVAATVLHEEGAGSDPELVDGLKRSLMCALGAVGDEFFWATLRPLAALAALPAALSGKAWAPLLLLAVYNVPHLTARGWGIAIGLARGRGVLGALQSQLLSRALPSLGVLGALLVGLLVGLLSGSGAWAYLPQSALVSLAAGLGVFAAALTLLASGVRPERLLAAVVLLALAAGAARVVLAP